MRLVPFGTSFIFALQQRLISAYVVGIINISTTYCMHCEDLALQEGQSI